MSWLQIVAILLCAGFFAKGGYNDHNFRRWYMPPVLALACYLQSQSLWAISVLACAPLLTLKDDDQGLLGTRTKCMYGFLACLGASAGLLYGHCLGIGWFLAYIGVGSFLYYAVKNLNQIGGDLIFGAWIGLLVLRVHSPLS